MRRLYPRIPQPIVDGWRRELAVPTNADQFRSRVDEILSPISGATLFNQGGLQFLREAHIASRVATALSADSVKLINDTWPDFEIRCQREERLFEVTEADMIGRRRGEEYLNDNGEIEEDSVEEWRTRLEAIPATLSSVISKKLAKNYPRNASLVVFVNLDCWGAYLSEGRTLLYCGTRQAKDAFVEVFALWEGRLLSLWKNGQMSVRVWNSSRLADF
jgi:hypothetical protein